MRPDGPMGRPFALLMERMNAAAYEATLDALALRPGESVLEIGFGTGDFLRRAARRMGSGALSGVDPAPLMVSMARDRLGPLAPAFAIDLHEAGADRLDWPEASFDAVAAIHSFQFWDAPEPALQRIRQLLKPGGRLCFCLRRHSDPPPDWLPNPMSRAPGEPRALIDLLARLEFTTPRQLTDERRADLVIADAP